MVEVDEIVAVTVQKVDKEPKVVLLCRDFEKVKEVILHGNEFDILAQEVYKQRPASYLDFGDVIAVTSFEIARSLIRIAQKCGQVKIRERGEEDG